MQVSRRLVGHEGVESLLWVTADRGAFGSERDGPLYDWLVDSPAFLASVSDRRVVVQAGGNCGMYPRFYKNYFDEVYTFEPDEINFYCLDQNCQGAGYHKYLGALGESAGTASLQHSHESNVGMHRIVDHPGSVRVYAIDELRLEVCDLIHLDVELYEERVLRGALDTIERLSPVIITEIGNGKELLRSLGYERTYVGRYDHVFTKT